MSGGTDAARGLQGQRRRNRWLKRELRAARTHVALLEQQIAWWKRYAAREYRERRLRESLRWALTTLGEPPQGTGDLHDWERAKTVLAGSEQDGPR